MSPPSTNRNLEIFGISFQQMNRKYFKAVLRILFAGLFVAAGILHFTRTKSYLQIMPPYLPFPLELVYISGVFEILGGAGWLIPRCRRFAGYG